MQELDPLGYSPSEPRGFARVALVLWLVVGALMLVLLWWRDTTPGQSASAPSRWPADAHVALATDVPTLLVTIHAYCPCSMATLDALAWVVDRAPTAHVVVLVEAPDDVDDDALAATRAHRLASEIPHVSVVRDRGGHDAALFDARTSGQAYLYEPDGTLSFEGGLTWARGHAGESEARSRLLAQLQRGRGIALAPVFGCPLGTSP